MNASDFETLLLPEDPQLGDYLIGTYLLRTGAGNILELASDMASEQTIGTWVEVPGQSVGELPKHAGKVLSVWEIPDVEQSTPESGLPREYVIQIAYPQVNIGKQLPMLLTTAFGNISMFGDIKLIDLTFPRELAEGLPGPQFGIEGVRKLLGIENRPLLNTMIKPSTGISPETGSELLYAAAAGGADIVKDDEVLADPEFSPALRRLEVYMKKLQAAERETGEKKLYALNVTDEPERCLRKAEEAVQNGANAIMINFLPAGLGLVSSLARDTRIRVPILAHLDFGGALFASPRHGISSVLLYGKLARLAGVDLITIPSPYGKFSLQHLKYIRIVAGLRGALYGMPKTFPIVGGGIRQGDLPRIVRDLGPDFVVGAGGAIYAHPGGPAAGARAFRQGMELVMQHGDFAGREKEFPELAAALQRWGRAEV
jgi:2,3-diketo-5-methylthiopentyl-1-phosphate enolase